MTQKTALNKLKEYCDFSKVLGSFSTPYFHEFVVDCGGDTLTFRVYNNGTITER